MEKRMVSKEPASSVHVMLALQGISILTVIFVPKSIGLNVLQFLTNTFHGWWQRTVGGIDIGCYASWETQSTTCVSPQEDQPATAPTPMSSADSGGFRSSGCALNAPTHQGCRPGGFSLEAERQKGKTTYPWALSLVKALLTCEGLLSAGSRCERRPTPF